MNQEQALRFEKSKAFRQLTFNLVGHGFTDAQITTIIDLILKMPLKTKVPIPEKKEDKQFYGR